MDALKLTYAGGAIQKRGGPFFKLSHQLLINTNPQSVSYQVCSVIGVYRFRACSYGHSSMCREKQKQLILCEQVRIGYPCVERQVHPPNHPSLLAIDAKQPVCGGE